MAALVGFDTWIGSAAVTLPITVAASLVSVALPAQAVVAGIDLDVSDLDANAVPLVRLNVGDTADADRFIVASTIARTGGMVEYRPLNSVWYRYTAAASVAATVHEAPVTGVAGAIAMTVYGYLAVDRAVLIRQTLQRLGVVAEGEAPRAEDAALALEALRDAHEMGVAVARAELHEAEPVAVGVEAHRLGGDGHDRAEIEPVGKVAFMRLDHRPPGIRPRRRGAWTACPGQKPPAPRGRPPAARGWTRAASTVPRLSLIHI